MKPTFATLLVAVTLVLFVVVAPGIVDMLVDSWYGVTP